MTELTSGSLVEPIAPQAEGSRAAGTGDALRRLGIALSDPYRRSVLLRLIDGPAYPVELAELCGTSRSNMSNHLNCLRGCGLIFGEREGRQIRYELVSTDFANALRSLTSVTLAVTCEHR